MRVGGVDGCRAGWVMVLVDNPGSGEARIEVDVCSDFGVVRSRCDEFGADFVGVDMPIGLAVDGQRAAEREARRRLGVRRSSLFPSPAHAVLGTVDWADALAVNRAVAGKGMSKQMYNLLPKIREVRSAVGADDQPRFSEVHPESSFLAMAGRLPAVKKSVLGQLQRLALVEQSLGSLLGWAAGSELTMVELDDSEFPTLAGAALDDMLDACAAAWTARRLAAGTADVLGADDGVDPDGYRLTISV